jgi:tetratricopeptide (TPR) repeat protein
MRRLPAVRALSLIGVIIAGCSNSCVSPALAYDPWTADAVNITAPLMGGSPVNLSTTTLAVGSKAPTYQDEGVENALDTSDYATAQSLISSKLSASDSARGAFGEAYLRTALVEALVWQGQLTNAVSENKKLGKILDGLAPTGTGYTADDLKELKARALDDQAWLAEALGKLDDAQSYLGQAIVLLKELHAADRQTWRLIGCMSHSAGLKAEAGDYPAARALLEEALSEVNGSHSLSPLNVADIQGSLGAVLYKLGDQSGATAHFSQALAIKNGTRALSRPYSPGPYWLSPTYKYWDGSPWSSKNFQNGVQAKVMDLGDIAIQCAVVRDKATKQLIQASVSVTNKTNQPIQFLGRQPVLIVLNPKATWAKLVQPTELAAKVEKKAEGKAKWVRFWGQGATQTVSSTTMGNMPMYGYGYGGGYPMNNSFYNGGMTSFSRNRNGDYHQFSTMQVPDPIAEARAFAKAQQIQDNGKAKAETIRSQSLGPCDIAPGQTINGSLYYDAGGLSKGSGCLLRIPIGLAQCEFKFDSIVDAP